jgi:hypothetical protein
VAHRRGTRKASRQPSFDDGPLSPLASPSLRTKRGLPPSCAKARNSSTNKQFAFLCRGEGRRRLFTPRVHVSPDRINAFAVRSFPFTGTGPSSHGPNTAVSHKVEVI